MLRARRTESAQTNERSPVESHSLLYVQESHTNTPFLKVCFGSSKLWYVFIKPSLQYDAGT